MDSLYAKAPVRNEIVEQNKIAVVRVKQENYNIIKDAAGLFAGHEPSFQGELSLRSGWYSEDQSGKKYTYRVETWDEKGFESWPGVRLHRYFAKGLSMKMLKHELLVGLAYLGCEVWEPG